jgi:glycerol-3-phosphate O-acyltransferase
MYFNGCSIENKDIEFVPVTINYDRIIEGDQFPLDLLGETKHKESFFKVAKVLLTNKKQLGKVIIRYGEPQSLQSYLKQYLKNN